MYSFHDLIALYVIAQLHKRGVSLKAMGQGMADLSRALETDRPFAHCGFRDGAATFRFPTPAGSGMVRDVLRDVEYGPDQLASVWRPARKVWISPRVQAGAACVEGTRIPTTLIFEIVRAGDHPVDVAADYDLDLEEVIAAHDYEDGLRSVA
jgi:uncharacterized protein (DUF433 family)